MEPYVQYKARFDFKDYKLVSQLYENSIKQDKIEDDFFKVAKEWEKYEISHCKSVYDRN